MTLGGELFSGLDNVSWSLTENGRTIGVTDANGNGWHFVIAQDSAANSTIIRNTDGSLVFQNSYATSQAGKEVVLSVIAIPTNAGGEDQRALWLDPNNAVTVEFARLNRDGTGGETLTTAAWDPRRGVYVVELASLGGRNWSNLDTHNNYNRHRVKVTNHTGTNVFCAHCVRWWWSSSLFHYCRQSNASRFKRRAIRRPTSNL